MINLGDEVKDVITGFKGIAVARHTYLQGCDRISVQPKINKDGEIPDVCAFDEPQLVVVKARKVAPPWERTDRGGVDKYPDRQRITERRDGV